MATGLALSELICAFDKNCFRMVSSEGRSQLVLVLVVGLRNR